MKPILFSFFWHPDKSVDVYEESKDFLDRSGLEPEITTLGHTYCAVGDLIPHTTENLWSGHFFPWVESWREIQISCNLALFGFYKQAMVSLRSGLELGLLSVYWNLNDDGHQAVKEWLRSRKDTPRLREIWAKLVKHRNFQEFQRSYDLQSRLLSFGYLHNYVHTKGHKFSNQLGMFKGNFQTFEEAAFTKWFGSFRDVIVVLSICHLVKYPLGTVRFNYAAKFGIETPIFGGLREHQVDWLEKLVGSRTFSRIAEIGCSDPQVQETLAWVKSLPHMSQEEVEQQCVGMDKQYIEMWGVDKWLEDLGKGIENAMGESIENAMGKEAWKERKEAWKERVAMLRAWAKERGVDKPPSQRKETPNNALKHDAEDGTV